jgi:hypothetical protein
MTPQLPPSLLGLLPESVLHSGWFAVLAAFVAINTVMYVVLATATMLPKVHVSDWFTSRDRRTQNRSIFPDPGSVSEVRSR